MSCLPEEKWPRQSFVETECQRSNSNQDSEPKIVMFHWSHWMEHGIFSGVVPLMLLILLPLFQTGIFILATLFFLYCCVLDRLEMVKLVQCPQDSKSWSIWPERKAFLPKMQVMILWNTILEGGVSIFVITCGFTTLCKQQLRFYILKVEYV